MWKTGTSVLDVLVLALVASFSLAAIMSATEAATSILLGVDGGLIVELEMRILGERFVKNVGNRGRKKVSVLVASAVRAVVVVVVMAWKRSGVLLGSKRGSPLPPGLPVAMGPGFSIGRIVSVEPLVPPLAPRVTLV